MMNYREQFKKETANKVYKLDEFPVGEIMMKTYNGDYIKYSDYIEYLEDKLTNEIEKVRRFNEPVKNEINELWKNLANSTRQLLLKRR